ncbi:LINE-1 retrotransposable element ORF2 protein [Holothuria leucospilota]|uniref:LINE-1 retrotransposable element ORF2 protein n=1 Tax=Holothuria leucospilota TaxID=206669 RepID=A0A9Q0YA93_HOLLE|nr:LINE-1 retrotransposable element ORF2 protein [Holothuria leucospilota]
MGFTIICFQDVHWTRDSGHIYYSEWGSDLFFSPFSSNARGVAILIDKKCVAKVLQVIYGQDGNYIILVIDIKGFTFNLVNIYGPNSDFPGFYDNVFSESFGIDCDFNIFCGDWNLVQDFVLDCDSYENVNNPNAQKKPIGLKQESHLVAPWRTLYPQTHQFTWRCRTPFRQARLDFLLVSENLLNFITDSNILPGYRTDHSIVVLDISIYNIKYGKGCWKFNNAFLETMTTLT